MRTPIYGVLAHGMRTNTMEMDRFNAIRDNLLLDNKAFIPTAEIKYISWLTRIASKKTASTVVGALEGRGRQ